MSNSHTRGAQFVGKRAVEHSSSDDHAADTHRSYALSSHAASIAALDHAALQYADHGRKYCFEGGLGVGTAARNICRQRHHGAGVLNVFEMLSREIRSDNLRANVGGRQIHFYAFPATLPVGVSEETSQNFGVQIAFAFEIAVEAAMRESRAGHDLLQGDIIKAATIK